MRIFIVLCLVATAYAQYSYQPSSGGSNLGGSLGGLGGNGGSLGGLGGSLGGLGGSLGGLGGSLGGQDVSSGAQGGSSGGQGGSLGGLGGSLGGLGDSLGGLGGSLGGLGGNLGGLGGGLGGPSSGLSSPSNIANSPSPQGDFPVSSNDEPSISAPAELEKEYYTFSANDNDFNDPASTNQVANSVKQGIRVIFIKGPENKGLEDAALNLAKQASNQKTDIYVLNKQADISDLSNKLNNVGNNVNNKPEVHFVKYRTPEDAANAQRAIQGQYDNLGGPSQSIDGGIAPVLNFASRAPASNGIGSATAPSGSYLPASVFRF